MSRDPRRGEFKRYESADEMREYFRQLPAWQGKDDEIEAMIQQGLEIKKNKEVRKNGCAQV